MSFWGELKRRNVFKVGAVYVIVAWVILQAVSIIFPMLHLPSWTGTFVTVLIIIGFPVALIFAWAFELTADGVKRTSEVSHDESITHVTGRMINYVLGGLLVIAVALLIFDNYYLDRRVVETEVSPVTADVEKVPKVIAVLPFADFSPEKDQEYFVDGLSEELLNCLAKIQDLQVIARTSSFAFKGTDKTIQEIADVLGANHILEGSVRKAGNALRITAQLIRTADGIHLWTETYNRKLEDIFEVQEDIATTVANELKITLGIGKSIKPLGGTDNVEAYELYLIAKGLLKDFSMTTLLGRAQESIDASIALDPKFALAWSEKANIHVRLAAFGPADRAMIEQNAALNAAQQAILIEPKLSSSYNASGFIKMSKGDWIDSGSAFRKSLELKTEPLSGSEINIVIHYHAVGYFKQAHEILEEMIQHDPLEPNVCANYILNLAYLGEIQRAEEEYELCKNMGLFGSHKSVGDSCITLIRLGTVSEVSSDMIVFSNAIFDDAKEYLDSPKEGLEELRRIIKNGDNLSSAGLSSIASWAAYFSDPDFAMDTFEKAVNIDASTLFDCWKPIYREVRQLPRFKEFLREIGLVDYWEKFGWPDICHPTDDGDFECD